MKGKKARYCIICEKKKFRLLKTVGDYKIFECENCKLAYTDSSEVTAKMRLEQTKILYNLPEYKKELKKHSKKFTKILRILRKFKKEGRLLDAGGGFGLFSKIVYEKSKFHVEIIEPYLEPYYVGREDIKTHRVKLENFLKKTKRKYDVVVLIDVLEHFEDPDQIIEDIKRVLQTKGLILLSVPNYKSLMAYLSKKWAWWMVEDHKYHFSTYSINTLMMKHKFKQKKVTTYENSKDIKKNLDGNFEHLPQPIKKISKIVLLVPFMVIYNILKPILWRLKLGGLTIGLYMKNEKN
jgi:2-polyprenyl-3-methyl-5-hydroxy-6-metoxy-1,4-benzoquinol methylase